MAFTDHSREHCGDGLEVVSVVKANGFRQRRAQIRLPHLTGRLSRERRDSSDADNGSEHPTQRKKIQLIVFLAVGGRDGGSRSEESGCLDIEGTREDMKRFDPGTSTLFNLTNRGNTESGHVRKCFLSQATSVAQVLEMVSRCRLVYHHALFSPRVRKSSSGYGAVAVLPTTRDGPVGHFRGEYSRAWRSLVPGRWFGASWASVIVGSVAVHAGGGRAPNARRRAHARWGRACTPSCTPVHGALHGPCTRRALG